MKSRLQIFDEEIKQRLKLEDIGTDGDKLNPHQWADLLDVDPDFRQEFFRVYQSDKIKDADEEPSPEICDVHLLNMEPALPRDGEGPEFVSESLLDSSEFWPFTVPGKGGLHVQQMNIANLG
jgi:hypothetical protein